MPSTYFSTFYAEQRQSAGNLRECQKSLALWVHACRWQMPRLGYISILSKSAPCCSANTGSKSSGGVIASHLWCVSFSGLNIKNCFECSWSCFWLPLRYGTSLMPSESMTISLFLVFWMRVKCQEGGGRKLVGVGIFNSINAASVFKGGSSKPENLKESRISPEFFYFFIRTERSEHLILSYLISAWRIQQQGSAYAPGRKMTSALFYFLALQSLPSLPSCAR